jgi:spore coat polysaccharide biosynthesis protein SpsF
MSVVAILQARVGSTRLPRKVLRDVAGQPMLVRDMHRLQRAQRLDKIVVATTIEPQDDELADFCAAQGWLCFRGSEQDVLDRYYQAAVAHAAEVIVRITSDCPLIDPVLVDAVVERFTAAQPPLAYMANFLPVRTYPRGLDMEIFSMSALARAWQEDTNPATREHVTPYLYQHPELFALDGFNHAVDYSAHRWTVDTAEDMELVQRIYTHFGHDQFGWEEVLAVLEAHPDWVLLNQHVEQKKLDQ